MDNQEVLVSIVVPCYNCKEYIEEFIDCILKQNYCNWELIMVDDGSTDGTISMIDKFVEMDNRIIFRRRYKGLKGSVVCRNIGQSIVNGKYIIHFDADDIVPPFCLEQRVLFMEQNSGVDYASFPGQSVKKDGTIMKKSRLWGKNPQKDLIECFLSVNYPFSVWNNIYKANVFKNELWDENVKIYTDFSYILPVLLKGYSHLFAENAEYDYFYRNGVAGAMTSNFISDEKYNSTKYLFAKTMESLENNKNTKNYKKNFERFFIVQYEKILMNDNKEMIDGNL